MREQTHGRHNATMVTVTPRGKCDGHTARKMGRAHALRRKGKAGMRVPYASVHITYLVSSGVLTSVELTLGAMHRVLLTQERLRDREPELNVPAQMIRSLTLVLQCACLGGHLKMVPL